MTLQQLIYVINIANTGSLSKTAENLYIAQPSLSKSLKELENELGFELFSRSNRGLSITSKGTEFLSYAKQIVDQYNLTKDKFISKKGPKQFFSVSTQHYSFAVKSFINTIKYFGPDDYELAIKETKTQEVIDDVKNMRSEIGILYQNHFNKTVLTKMFKDYDITFTKLFTCKIYAYMSQSNPLSNKNEVTLDELQNFPLLTFEQNNSFYFSEEVLSTYNYKQTIKTNDRATMLNLMIGINGYTLCSGIISNELNGDNYVAIPLKSDEVMDIGYIKKTNIPLSKVAEIYIDEIKDIYSQSLV